jgi:UDP-glucose:(glucosyl)LPS alpha-1,2-glucosyltransferase
MSQIIDGIFTRNETNENSMGGTEQLTMELAKRLDPELLKECQIISSRIRGDLQDDKIRVFWAHDLPTDPESHFLKNSNMIDSFHVFVFVSNWQMQSYMNTYQIPWSKCVVLLNAIEPIEEHVKPSDGKINLIYHSTPHRGLNILAPVFAKLCEKHDNIHLNVYSSFELYGWKERDSEHTELFDMIDSHEHMTNHGTVSNKEIREALKESHILGYPSIWPETSCMVLMESMSAGLVCVHSNYAALYETAANWTQMYQLNEDSAIHAGSFYNMLDASITNYNDPIMQSVLAPMRSYTNVFYAWQGRVNQWNALLTSLINSVEDRSVPKETFNYKAG